MSAGRFITLEGGEGAGKSTQLAAVAMALQARGIEVVRTREPGGSKGAEAIRQLLLTGAEDRWNAAAEALLFAAARADHVEKLIRPALARGCWVLCDRYIDSNRAYQSGASGLADEDILTLHRIGSDSLMPDRTFVLTLPAQEAEARTRVRDNGATDRFGGRDTAFHQRVSDAFVRYCELEPDRIRCVDASGTAEEVTARLMSQLTDLLP